MSSSKDFPARGIVGVSVVILTRNEEANIRACLESCGWSDDVHVLDSESTDRTRELAAELGAAVHVHAFESFGKQRNWAIDNIPLRHDWVFHLDADERFTAALVDELAQNVSRNPTESGFHVANKLMFMGRWLKHASGYPVYQMRFFHKSRMRFEDYGHGQREHGNGPIGQLHEPYLHFNFSKGIADWLQRHNRYSTLEAKEIGSQLEAREASCVRKDQNDPIQRRRFFKSQIYPHLPGKWLWRFGYTYFVQLGILDGLPGLQYSLLMSFYELMIGLKVAERKCRAIAGSVSKPDNRNERRSLRYSEEPGFSPSDPALRSTSETGVLVLTQSPGSDDVSNVAMDETMEDHPPANTDSPAMTAITERNSSPWTTRQKVARVLWTIVYAMLFRPSFHNFYAWRRMLLRLFGAKIGVGVRIRPTVRIEIPWNLDIDDYAAVGDYAILYSLGKITLGKLSTISQYAHLCAGTHDYTTTTMRLVCSPITIGEEAWVATDAFVGPGITVGRRAIVGARATVINDVAPGEIVAGNPAKRIRNRDQ